MRPHELWTITRETARDWSDDNATRLAASLAYYSVLSVAPMLVLAVSVAGLVYGEDAARGQLAKQLATVVGDEAGRALESLVSHARSVDASSLGSALSAGVLLFGASGVFGELQASMNEIWKVEPRAGLGVRGFLRARFFSFSMVLGVAFLLLVSLVVSALLSALSAYFTQLLPGGAFLWEGLNFVFSLFVIAGLFALIFKVVPDVDVRFRDVRMGAFVTALLFSIGKYALGLYLGRESLASPYGAAGSLIVFVVWVYYAAQILLMGAEFTQVYARHRGSHIQPSAHAVQVELTKDMVDSEGGSTRSVSSPRTA
jgi:membrane protein